MPHIDRVKLGVALGAALALGIPAAASAATPASGAPAAPASPGGLVFADPEAPTVFADGSTLAAPVDEIVGGTVVVRGTLAGSRPGDSVLVQRLDAVQGWLPAATGVVGADGTYAASWHTDHAGRMVVRALPAGQPATASTAASAAGAPGRQITIYRRTKVTWYGPGFYGKKTACGRKLTRTTLGVANKSLRCGTMVALYNAGRSVTVPVIDRGPFRRGTSYDLTAATAKAIGVTTTATIGAVSVPAASTPASTATPDAGGGVATAAR